MERGLVECVRMGRSRMATMPLITEDTLAVSLAERECSRLRYVCQWKRWIICGKDGQWRLDEKQSAFQLASLLCREASASAHAAGMMMAPGRSQAIGPSPPSRCWRGLTRA
jgi:hypothetical protein